MHIPIFVALNIVDLCILILKMSFSSITKVKYGFIVVLLTSFTLNKTLKWVKSMAQSKLSWNKNVL